MDTKDLNEYFNHYLQKDKTNSALMLTAPWGVGKSHYIKTELLPFLKKNKLGYAMISLYGLNDLAEISKSLYLELRLNRAIEKVKKGKEPKNKVSKWFHKHGKEVASYAVGLGRTIIKGVASFFNVDINFSDKDLQKIFKSVDLTNKLIILEDLERSGVDIIEILGFVNNLVEQDNIKVLLVANENEILKYEEQEELDENSKDKPKKKIKVLTENSKKYLETKEKTVSDTILFTGQVKKAIKTILLSFDNPIINLLAQETNEFGACKIAYIIYEEIMQYLDIQSENLRALIYACQKTADIFNSIENKIDINFAKHILMSNIAFSLRKKQNDNLIWESQTEYSDSLGTYKYPLIKYCYLNIKYQYSSPEMLKLVELTYIDQQERNRKTEQNNADLKIVYNFYENSEAEVVKAINNIKELLKDTTAIYPTQYGKLANYLIAIKDAIGYDDIIGECKRLMLLNIAKVSCDDLADRITYHNGFQLSGDALKEFQTYKDEMLKATAQKRLDLFDFDYKVDKLEKFCEEIHAKRDKYVNYRGFARKIDNDRLIKMLVNCLPHQISDIIGVYHSVYSFSNINEFFMDDKDALIDLRQKVDNLIKTEKSFDKIQILQLNWFIDALDSILQKLQV